MPESVTDQRAFSLIELVIVLVIVGIVAAIAVPRLSKAKESSALEVVKANVRTIQRGLDHMWLEHPSMDLLLYDEHGTYETAKCLELLDPGPKCILTNTTNQDFEVSESGFGPYLKSIPYNSLMGSTANKFQFSSLPPGSTGFGWALQESYDSEVLQVGYYAPNPDSVKFIPQFE